MSVSKFSLEMTSVTGGPCPVNVSISLVTKKSPLSPMYHPVASTDSCCAPPPPTPGPPWPQNVNWASPVLSESNSTHPQNPPSPPLPQKDGSLQLWEIP